MPRRRRKDFPGAWWHLGNRAVDRGLLFRGPEDYRYFLSLLAHVVHRGWLEVHAYCLMPNHFHLLVRSMNGELSETMQWVEDRYANWFNRRHGRAGCLFEGRFWGKIILSFIYRIVVLGYIHANPRRAGLGAAGRPYDWSSEHHHESGRGRPWLARSFGSRVVAAARRGDLVRFELAEQWRRAPNHDLRDLDALLVAHASGVGDWLVANATRLDRPMRPRFLVVPETLATVLHDLQSRHGPATVRPGRQARDAWLLLATGLGRTVCATSLRDLAEKMGVSLSMAHERVRQHRRALLGDEAYALLAGRVLRACLEVDYGPLARAASAAVAAA